MNRSDSFENVYVGVYMDDREEERDPYFNGKGPPRKPCIECAGCMVGCRENAKNSLDKNYLYFAEKLGTEILAETKVVRIECNHTQYIVYTRSSTRLFSRKARKFRCKGLILAGGSLGTLELLLK
ncbi:MAG: GMC family oxidoreductase N-terminal domain-containing protein, partial [Calditrichia bacterium]|nr:GMC family oxidoreductase N-terminal domain-containing protein [Calditrichia bacterium]